MIDTSAIEARTISTREIWLDELVEALRPMYDGELPATVHVSVGFPSRGGMRSKTIGECWSGAASADGAPQVFVHPKVADGQDVAAIVAHELVHAARPDAKHGKAFKQLATAIGLEGKMTATTAGNDLAMKLQDITNRLGAYPHPALSGEPSKPKQSTRLIKVQCIDCDYTVRTTQKWLDVGLPTCPCGTEMYIPE